MLDLQNKTIVITGASYGLGASLAQKLAAEKANLVLAARSADKLQDLAKNLGKKFKIQILIVPTDVTHGKDIQNLIKQSIKKFDSINVFINNAGINIKRPYFEFSEEEWQQVMDTNTKSVFLAAKYLQPVMKSGQFVTISSLAGFHVSKYYSLYSASKFAVEGYLKGLKREFPKSIRILTFRPFRLKTELHRNYHVPSPLHHKIDPDLFADFVVAKIKKDYCKTAYYGLRNILIWGKQLLAS